MYSYGKNTVTYYAHSIGKQGKSKQGKKKKAKVYFYSKKSKAH